jgi:Ecdysteroid kinase-like family
MTESLPRAITADHLTDALRRSGALGRVRVREVVVESSRPTVLSRIIRLRLAYDDNATDAPRSVILKTGPPQRAGGGWYAGRQEVAFYTQVAVATPADLIPRCFDAHWDEETNEWHLVLEDLTDSHAAPTAWPLPPSMAQCESILQTWARFHAAWWDEPRLGVAVGTRPDGGTIDRYRQDFADRFARFVDRFGEHLPTERRALYERLIEAAPGLLAQRWSCRNVTITHGDAHFWNVLLPRSGGDVRLFDWDSWRIDVGTSDLAYMMAMHWYPDRRHRVERLLLDRYHAALLAHGVQSYERQALADDYRLSVLWLTRRPVFQASVDIPPRIWWNNLERILLAVDDLDCRDLLS